jgi:hypothetical protein
MSDVLEIYDVSTEAIEVITEGPQGPPGSGGGGGSGTVTSVALAGTGLSISGSPITASGTITANVSYGTTAGTACQGNDSRISGIQANSITTGYGSTINLQDQEFRANLSAAGYLELSEIGFVVQSPEGGDITTINNGGDIDTHGTVTGDTFSGGSISTYGDSDDGGNINTSNGGGSIDTRGTGSIELGVSATRTTLVGSASGSDKTVTLPNATGTVALTEQASDYEVTDATKGVILKSPNNSRWRITIDNDGNLSSTKL